MAARRTKRTKRKRKIQERDLRGWKWLARFQELLAAAREAVPPGPRVEHGRRRLHAGQYPGLFLFGLFNPVLESMRGLCEASHLRRVREQTGAEGPVALSRFSDAQHVFDPELLRQVIGTLVEEGGAQLGASCGGKVDAHALRIVDSTLWKVVPRMKWAQYGGGFLVRVKAAAVLNWQSDEPLSDAERAAGIVRAGRARLGSDTARTPQTAVRVVRIEPEGKEPVLLVASACFEDMSPGEIGELYRKRWQVEPWLPGAAAPALRAALRAGCLAPLGSNA